MSEEQITIAIAEACGWTDTDIVNCGGKLVYGQTTAPDYCGDLNAMHEAEKVLIEKGVNYWWLYVGFINRHNPTPLGVETAVHATARQRAEAFLRTIGKWEETLQ